MKKIKMVGSKFLAITLSLLIVLSMGQTVHANTIDEIWVNGTNISTALANTVQCGNGTAVYDNATNTLTLNNAQITQKNVAGYGIENKSNKDFNIILQGSNSIDIPNTTGVFAYTEANMNFSGGGSLDIKAPQSIANHKNITFDNVTITASASADGSIVADGNIIIRNNANITCTGLYFGFNVMGSVTITNSTVNATATGDNMNAFFITDKIIIEESSDVTATSYFPPIFSESDINISDSTINATSTADWGIWSRSNLTISGDSEVISKGLTGSIGASNSFKITPALDETVEIFLGADEDNVTALEGSPFSVETDLKAFNVGTNLYFHSKTHTHVASEDWSKDDTNHWQECTADDGEKMNVASHTYGEWIIDTPATENAEGSKHRDCSVCAYRETAAISKLPSKDTTEDDSAANDIIEDDAAHKDFIVEESTGTKIEYESGSVFVTDISLVVTPKSAEEMKKHQNNVDKVGKGLSIAGLYDIKLLKNGVEIQPNGRVKITLALTNEMKTMSDLQVVYIDDNDNVMIVPSQLINGKLVFVTDHFSYYGVIGKEKQINPIQPENPEIPDSDSTSNPTSPQTGDTSNTMIYLALIAFSGGLAVISIKRKRALNQ